MVVVGRVCEITGATIVSHSAAIASHVNHVRCDSLRGTLIPDQTWLDPGATIIA